jgi:radical SAM protein with 4Fe4S-binding SPASM domain
MKQLHSWGNQIDVAERTSGVADTNYGDIFHPCILPWSTMQISAMGIVALCPQDYDATFKLGDINSETIAEVWHNEKWANIRRLHSTGNRNEIEMCRGCKIYDLDFTLEKKDSNTKLYTS